MEKKDLSFIEKFEAAGQELVNAINEIKDGTMIMIAIEGDNEKGVSAHIRGKSNMIGVLLSYVACKCDGFKTILEKALMYAELQEQTNK